MSTKSIPTIFEILDKTYDFIFALTSLFSTQTPWNLLSIPNRMRAATNHKAKE